jgi:DNA-binding transcriptional ArsR family regulator
MSPVPRPVKLADRGPSDEQVDAAVHVLSLLADSTRLRLLWALSAGECDVSSLVRLGGATKTATSQHLARLRAAGLVTVRREGRRGFYRLQGGHIQKLVREVLHQADHLVQELPPHE